MKATLDDFKVGNVLYESRGYDVQAITVTKDAYKPDWQLKGRDIWFSEVQYEYNFGNRIMLMLMDISLSDSGIEGHQYDHRPCMIYTTEESAIAAYSEIIEWRKYLDRCNEWDDYYDYED